MDVPLSRGQMFLSGKSECESQGDHSMPGGSKDSKALEQLIAIVDAMSPPNSMVLTCYT